MRRFSVLFSILFAVSILLVSGCQYPGDSTVFEPGAAVDSPTETAFTGSKRTTDSDAELYREAKSVMAVFNPDLSGYEAVDLSLDQGSRMTIPESALRPPRELWGEDFKITMMAEYDTQAEQLSVAFGPQDLHFSPSAELRLKYDQSGDNLPALYRVDEKGDFIRLHPDEVDTREGYLIVMVNEFSRYVLTRE